MIDTECLKQNHSQCNNINCRCACHRVVLQTNEGFTLNKSEVISVVDELKNSHISKDNHTCEEVIKRMMDWLSK